MTPDKTYIYALINPKNDYVFYIGKADNPKNRFEYGHLVDKSNTNKTKYINFLLKQNIKPELLILDEIKFKEWPYWENFYFSLYKSYGFDLTNSSDTGSGGDTLSNHPNKEAIILRMRKKHKKIERGVCIHCKKEFAVNILKAKHNDRCKFNENITSEDLEFINKKRVKYKHKRDICIWCKENHSVNILKIYHNDNCKLNPNITEKTLLFYKELSIKRIKAAIGININYKPTLETKKKISISQINRFINKRNREVISYAIKNLPKLNCNICGYKASPAMIGRWHNDRCVKNVNK